MATLVETTATLTNSVDHGWARLTSQRSGTDAPVTTSIPLSFLRRLAADAGLRAELEASPMETLARHGICVAPHDLPADVRLPNSRDLDDVVLQYSSGDDDKYANPTHFWGFLGGVYA